ncbi:MAG: hypothetical protein GY842_25070, partial [bacterium]|nr:hypothetical protein [bacterium]
FTRFGHDPADPSSLSHDEVTAIIEDSRGRIWLATYGGGLNRLIEGRNGEPDCFERFTHNPADPHSLGHDNLFTLGEDNQGNLWVGSYGRGLSLLDSSTERFSLHQHHVNDTQSLSVNHVTEVYEDTKGTLWVAGFAGYLDGFPPQDSQSEPVHLRHDPPLSIFAIAEAGDCLWLGTYGAGLTCLDQQGSMRTLRHDPQDPTGLPSDRIIDLLVDPDGDLWIGTQGRGLARLEAEHFEQNDPPIRTYRPDPEDPASLTHDHVVTLEVDSRGTLWIGTDGGGLNRVDELDPADGRIRFTHYQHDDDDPSSLSHDVVYTIFEDASGTLWVGTDGGGLNRFDRERLSFAHYRKSDGLSSDTVRSILEDDDHRLWIGTGEGITCFDPDTLTFSRFDTADGLQGDTFDPGLAARCRGGRFLFGGRNGLTSFAPSAITASSFIPPVVLTDFQLFASSVPIGSNKLPVQINHMDRLVLSHEDAMFAFEFSALSYCQAKDNRFVYRLEGFDDDWRPAVPRHRLAVYTNIPAGDYL